MPARPDVGDVVLSLVLVLGALVVLLFLAMGPGTASKILARLVIGAIVLTFRVVAGLLRVGAYAVVALVGGRGSISGAPGGERVLAPGGGSRPAPPAGDYRDYRGLAQVRELDMLFAGDLTLGRYVSPHGRPHRPLFLHRDVLHRGCVIVGPTGSGKTESLILPWILTLLRGGASVVTVDVKGDLYDRLAPAAETMGARLWYWNSADLRSQSWNWLQDIEDERDVEAAVQSILGRRNPNDPQPFFYERDCRWLRALVQIAHAVDGSGATPGELYHLLADRQRLERCFHDFPPARRHESEVADLMRFPPEEYSRAVSGLLNALHLFNAEDVQRISERGDFDLDQITQRPTLLIVGASLAEAGRSEVLSALLLNRVFNEIYRRFRQQPAARPGPVFLAIDEAARLQNRIPYEEVLSVVRSAHVGVCLALQDVAQFGDEKRRSAILANCLTMILLRGCSPQTAEEFARRLGQRQERFLVETESRGFWDLLPTQRGAQVQTMSVPVLQPREIMHPPEACGRFCAVVQVQPVSAKPFLVDLTRDQAV